MLKKITYFNINLLKHITLFNINKYICYQELYIFVVVQRYPQVKKDTNLTLRFNIL